jgi:hypothetical protein
MSQGLDKPGAEVPGVLGCLLSGRTQTDGPTAFPILLFSPLLSLIRPAQHPTQGRGLVLLCRLFLGRGKGRELC